jgi:hypothetical protein
MACLILAGPAVFALLVVLGAGRHDNPPERDQAAIDAEFANITKRIKE